MIVQSMPGAGGLLAANFLYASAPQDGTTIGILNSTVPFAPLWGSKGVRFDTLKFNWLGTLDRAEGVCTLWHTSPVKTWSDMLKTWSDMLVKEITVGSIGAGSEMELYPAMLNKLFATRIKVVAGYKAGSDIDLAMERGELGGPLRHPSHLVQGAASWLVRRTQDFGAGHRRGAAACRSPRHARGDGVRAGRDNPSAARIDDGGAEHGPPVLAPPGVPSERVKELRAAFDATMADQTFRADIEKRSLHIDPMRGVDMAAAYARALSFPPEIIAAVRDVMGAR